MKCKNCKLEFTGDFCNYCGQKASVKRLDLIYLRDELANSILQLDRGIFYTIKQLLTNPGHSIRGFIEGQRTNHFKPIAFLFIAATLYVFSNKILGNTTFINQFIEGFEEGGDGLVSSAEEKIFVLLTNYQVYIILIGMLIFSFASFVAFLRSGYNLLEHLVLNFYISGIQFLMYTIFSFIILDEDSTLVTIPLILGFIYNLWTYFQFFKDMSIIKRTSLLLLTYLFYMISLLAMMIIIFLMGKYFFQG